MPKLRQHYLQGHRASEQRLSVWLAMETDRLDAAAAEGNHELVYQHASMVDALIVARNRLRERIGQRESNA